METIKVTIIGVGIVGSALRRYFEKKKANYQLFLLEAYINFTKNLGFEDKLLKTIKEINDELVPQK